MHEDKSKNKNKIKYQVSKPSFLITSKYEKFLKKSNESHIIKKPKNTIPNNILSNRAKDKNIESNTTITQGFFKNKVQKTKKLNASAKGVKYPNTNKNEIFNMTHKNDIKSSYSIDTNKLLFKNLFLYKLKNSNSTKNRKIRDYMRNDRTKKKLDTKTEQKLDISQKEINNNYDMDDSKILKEKMNITDFDFNQITQQNNNINHHQNSIKRKIYTNNNSQNISEVSLNQNTIKKTIESVPKDTPSTKNTMKQDGKYILNHTTNNNIINKIFSTERMTKKPININKKYNNKINYSIKNSKLSVYSILANRSIIFNSSKRRKNISNMNLSLDCKGKSFIKKNINTSRIFHNKNTIENGGVKKKEITKFIKNIKDLYKKDSTKYSPFKSDFKKMLNSITSKPSLNNISNNNISKEIINKINNKKTTNSSLIEKINKHNIFLSDSRLNFNFSSNEDSHTENDFLIPEISSRSRKTVNTSSKKREYPNMVKKNKSKNEILTENETILNNDDSILTNIKYIKSIEKICKKGFAGPGIKKTNQDNFFIFNNFNNNSNYIYMGVCDGHGIFGQDISTYLVNHLPKNLNDNLNNKNIFNYSKNQLNKIITKTFSETNNNLNTDERIDSTYSGSTCTSLIFTPKKFFTINVGDSRCILAKYNNKNKKYFSKILTKDHKPNDINEKNRIIFNGGKIEPYKNNNNEFYGPERVWIKEGEVPGLAMSRSFGDEIAHTVGVIEIPEINEYDFCKEDKFLVIASDGIWEFINNDEVVDLVKDFYESNDVLGAVNCLYKEASKRWIMEEDIIDDITVILVFLN